MVYALPEPGESDDLVQLLTDVGALEPVNRAVQEDVLPSSQVWMEASAELEQRANPAAHVDPPGRRLDDSGDQTQEGGLTRSVPADQPDRATRLDSEGHITQREDFGGPGPAARHDDVLEPPGFAGIHLEVPRRPVGDDLSGSNHASEGTASARRTRPASTRMKAGSAFGISIRLKSIPSSRARSAASWSRSQRISRWSATKPTGQTSTLFTPFPRSSSRWSRMSGPSHGSPVGDSLWNENDQSLTSAASATSREVSSSCSLYGSPRSRIRAGSECAVNTTCASVPRILSASRSTKPLSSCQLSTKRRSARPSSADSSWSR